MEAKVGARIEVVTPKRWVAGPDLGVLLVLLSVSAGLHGWLVASTKVTARDGIGFARLALNLESPTAAPGPPKADGTPWSFIDVLRTAEHPPGYPVTVLSMSYAVRPIHPGPLPELMLLSCQLAAAAAGVLLVVPTYLLGRSLFGRFPGFAAALLFQVLPVTAHVTSDGLCEALYLLCTTTSLGFGTRAVRLRSTLNFLLCGMAAGAAYLVRPEGLMVVLAVGAVVAGLGVLGRWPRDVAVGRLIALGVGAVLVAAPYVVLIGGLSNKSTPNAIWERIKGENPKARLGTWDQGDARPDAGAALFAAWYVPGEGGGKEVWAAREVSSEVFKAAHYTPALLAVVGFVLLRRRIVSEPAVAVLPILAVINTCVLWVLGLKVGYVSERHTLILVLILCYFAVAALEPLARIVGLWPRATVLFGTRPGAVGMLAALVASALPSAVKPLHANREGHYHAGRYLEAAATPADVVADPFSWASFYSGRSLYHVPDDPAGARVLYAVWENNKDNPHSRLPRRELALNIARDGWSQVVFHWPRDLPPHRAKVLVYKLDTGTQDAVRAAAGGTASAFFVRRDSGIPRP